MAATSFQELEVWKKAHAMVLAIYRLTSKFPREELFGLTSQLRRAAVSVPANIAEGFVKRGVSDKLRFYNISQGSLEECRYYLILSRDLDYGQTAELLWAIDEVSRMLDAYISAINTNRRGDP
jgi:four helix bundle protein